MLAIVKLVGELTASNGRIGVQSNTWIHVLLPLLPRCNVLKGQTIMNVHFFDALTMVLWYSMHIGLQGALHLFEETGCAKLVKHDTICKASALLHVLGSVHY